MRFFSSQVSLSSGIAFAQVLFRQLCQYVLIFHVCSFSKHRKQMTMWCLSKLICLHHTTPAAVTQGSHQKGSRKSARGESGDQEVCNENPSSRNVRATFGFDSNSCGRCELIVV